MRPSTGRSYFFIGAIVLLGVFLLNISLGSVTIPFKDTINSLLNQPVEKESWRYIIQSYRLPKAVTAVIVGSGLALSGLLMQTLFRNPLAGPYILGISSGASLGVALLIMGGSLLGGVFTVFAQSGWGLIFAASAGSFMVMLAVIAASFRMKNTMAILIIGIMFSAFTGAIVAVLSFFSPSEQLQRYVFWSFGSLGNISSSNLLILFIFWLFGLLISIFCIKDLNALLLGEKYAESMGTNIKRSRLLVILASSILAGSTTAFAGPIAFVGLAVPHLVRLLIPKNNHLVLLPAVLLGGALLMLVCDSIAQLPGHTATLPINAVTSLFGAPVVIWLLVRKRKLVF